MNKFEHDKGVGGSLYGDLQCIMGNGHMGSHVGNYHLNDINST